MVIRVNKKVKLSITYAGEHLEQVDKFQYLGVMFN